jgi:multicomponent Na+:H+ antiporter subunit G
MNIGWFRIILASVCLLIGLFFMLLAVFGVNRFHRALNRMHAAAMGDTMGILFVMLGLVILRGFSMDSLKLLLVIGFFWIASPVSSHMLARLEAMTDEDLGELEIIHVDDTHAEDVSAEAEKSDKNPGACSREMEQEEQV